MNKNAIERIKDYCCEVTQEQWEELVRVADEVGVDVEIGARELGTEDGKFRYAQTDNSPTVLVLMTFEKDGVEIPFPSFLAKLKGWDGEGDPFTSAETLAMASKPWQPKAGCDIDFRVRNKEPWHPGTFIGMDGPYYVVRWEHHPRGTYQIYSDGEVRRPIPTITREQAEKELNKRIID